jgi:hypothetical protein
MKFLVKLAKMSQQVYEKETGSIITRPAFGLRNCKTEGKMLYKDMAV